MRDRLCTSREVMSGDHERALRPAFRCGSSLYCIYVFERLLQRKHFCSRISTFELRLLYASVTIDQIGGAAVLRYCDTLRIINSLLSSANLNLKQDIGRCTSGGRLSVRSCTTDRLLCTYVHRPVVAILVDCPAPSANANDQQPCLRYADTLLQSSDTYTHIFFLL